MTMTCGSRSRTVVRTLALAVTLTGASTTALVAQVATGTLQGHVRDTAGRPIRNARVIVVGTSFSAPTDSTGAYRIELIPPGVFPIRAMYVGFTPMQVQGIRVVAGQAVQRDFALKAYTATEQVLVVTDSPPNRLVGRTSSGARKPAGDDDEETSFTGR